jgi:hypothetical protein
MPRNYHKTKPLQWRSRSRNKQVLTFAHILCEMMYRTCPFDTTEDDYHIFFYDLHCGEVKIVAKCVSKPDEAPNYHIKEVVFGCESMSSGCEDCNFDYYYDIERG